MNPQQLQHLRESRGLTREEMVEELSKFSKCSVSGLVKWERGERAIPEWVEQVMLRNVPVTLPLEKLEMLLNVAKRRNQNFSQFLAEAIEEKLAKESERQIIRYDFTPQAESRVAEEPLT